MWRAMAPIWPLERVPTRPGKRMPLFDAPSAANRSRFMSHAEVFIRQAAQHEVSEIEAVCVAAYAEYRNEVPVSVFEGYIDDLRRLSDHWHEAEVLVAEVGGHIGGSVLFYTDASMEGLGLPRG